MGEARTNNEPTETNRPNKGRFTRPDPTQQQTNETQQARDLGSNTNQQETNGVGSSATDKTNGPRSKTLLSPSGRVLPGACTRERLPAKKQIKAGQITEILLRVSSTEGPFMAKADRLYGMVNAAITEDHDPEEILLGLVELSREMRDLPSDLGGVELGNVAAGLFS